MPGIHLIKAIDDSHKISEDEERVFLSTLKGMNHFRWYSTDILYKDSNMILGRSHYIGYPFTVFENEKWITVIEGCMYNKLDRAIKEELAEFCPDNSTPAELAEQIKGFVSKTDGEFLVAKYDKQRRSCLVFNDALGRLPLYYLCPNSQSALFVMSREIKFIVPFIAELDVDKTALADYLLFGHSLGDRTLWKDVRRLPPATMLMTNVEKKGLVLKETLSWNLDPRSGESKNSTGLHQNTSTLVNLFIESIKGIADKFSDGYTQVVSLSGGLDSRATLAGLRQIGMSPIACSYPSGEIPVARKIAGALKVNHYTTSSSHEISDEDYVELTDGLLDIGLRFLISYLYGIKENAGTKAILYTGDGGDKTLGPLHSRSPRSRARSDISNMRDLVSYIIEGDRIFDLDEISLMLNMPENDLREHLESHLNSYPEDTMEGKFIHFKVFERGFKYVFVGEDRNRFFLWSTTPFFSLHFFSTSIKESQRLKEHYMLYKDFLWNLNPVLTRIRYYNRLIPLSIPNWLLKPYLIAFEWFKKHLYIEGASNLVNLGARAILIGEPTPQMPDKTKNTILRQLNQRDVFDFLDTSRVAIKIGKEKNQTKLNVLATLILHVSITKDKSLSNPVFSNL